MDDQRLTSLLRELYDEGGDHPAPPFLAAEVPSHRRRWLAIAGATVAAAVVVIAVSLSNTSSNTTRLVPVEGPTTSTAPSPTPATSPTPSPTSVPSPPDDPQSGVVYPPTGIYSQGPQISGTRWMNVNAWWDRVTPTTSLDVYAGGATIAPSQLNPNTYAAVLVITPADIDKLDDGQVAEGAIGTIYRAPGNPIGKLQVTSATGNLLILTLVGTSQTYVFNDTTMTFQ